MHCVGIREVASGGVELVDGGAQLGRVESRTQRVEQQSRARRCSRLQRAGAERDASETVRYSAAVER